MALRPDLTGARARLEGVLFGDGTDVPATVRITRDPEGADDDTFNTTTGAWTRVGQTVVYTGPASFRAGSADPNRRVDVGGSEELRTEWHLRLPLSAPAPSVGDFVTIRTNVRDPSQVGRLFRVDRVLGSSMAIVQRLVMSEYHPLAREINRGSL